MKYFLLLTLILGVACSKQSVNNLNVKSLSLINYEEINLGITNGIISAGSNFNYGDIPTGTLVKHDIIVKNNSIAAVPIVVNSASSGLTYTMSPIAQCSSLARAKTCTITVSFQAGENVPSPDIIAEEIVINNASIEISGKIVSPVLPIPAISVPSLNLGNFNGTAVSLSVQIINQDLKAIPAPGLIFNQSELNSDFKLDYSDCQRIINSRTKCRLIVTYNSIEKTAANIVSSFKIYDKEYPVSINRIAIPEDEEQTIPQSVLTNYSPSTGILDFGNKIKDTGDSSILTMRIKNEATTLQRFTEIPTLEKFTLVSNGCAAVSYRSYCNITMKFNSNGKTVGEHLEKFIMVNDKAKIEFDLRINITSNETPIACTLSNGISGGGILNTNNAVLGVIGTYPSCSVNSCQPLYIISSNFKSCEPLTTACSSSDALDNGVELENINLSITPVISGNVIAGNKSACLINQCAMGFTKDGYSKKCIQDSKNCSSTDIILLGGNSDNALIYSGQVILNDPQACKIDSCTSGYAPSANGLSCEYIPVSVQKPVGSIIVTDYNNQVYAVDGTNKMRLDNVGGLFHNKLTASEISEGYYWANYFKISESEFFIQKTNSDGIIDGVMIPYIVNTDTGVFHQVTFPQGITGLSYSQVQVVGKHNSYIYLAYKKYINTKPYVNHLFVLETINKEMQKQNLYSDARIDVASICRKVGTRYYLCVENAEASTTTHSNPSFRVLGDSVFIGGSSAGYTKQDSYNHVLLKVRNSDIGKQSIMNHGYIHTYNNRAYVISNFGVGKIFEPNGGSKTFQAPLWLNDQTQKVYMYKNFLLYKNIWKQIVSMNMDNPSQATIQFAFTNVSPSYSSDAVQDSIVIQTESQKVQYTRATNLLATGYGAVEDQVVINLSTEYQEGYYGCSNNKWDWNFLLCWQHIYIMYPPNAMYNDPDLLMSNSQDTIREYSRSNENLIYLSYAPPSTPLERFQVLGKYNSSTDLVDLILRFPLNRLNLFIEQELPLNDDTP